MGPYRTKEYGDVLLRLLILLTVVPLVELVILLRMADRFSWESTIALVILTGVVGAYLARHEGLKVARRVSADLSAGVMPAQAVVEGMLILLAGVLLVTPGILTDLCGFGLLVPTIRVRVRRWLARTLEARITARRTTQPGRSSVRVEADGSASQPDQFIDVVPTNSRDANESGDANQR